MTPKIHAGDDSIPEAGSGTFSRKTAAQLAQDSAFTGTYTRLLTTDAVSTSASGTLAAWHLTPVDATSGAATWTLPAANSVVAGVEVAVKKADTSANTVVVNRAGSDLIFGTGTGATSKTLTLAGEAVTFVSDGTSKWTIQTSDTPSGALASTYVRADKIADSVTYGNGTTDATAHIQALINATPQGGTLAIPRGTYKLTSALTISDSIRIIGAGAPELFGSVVVDSDPVNVPMVSPYLLGTVLLQTTAATDGIQITALGRSVDLEGFGIRFDDAIRFQNTGNGITCTPATLSTYHDSGIIGAKWKSVKVYGHDGNHYAFDITNPIYCTFEDLRGYGGGLLRITQDSTAAIYGNSVFTHTYGYTLVSGTADCYRLRVVNTGTNGLNLISFTRPQGWVGALHTQPTSTSAPTSAQKVFNADQDRVSAITLTNPDFETNVSSTTVLPLLNSYAGPGKQLTSGVPTGNPTAGTRYQNTTGGSLMGVFSITYNPTAGAAATFEIDMGTLQTDMTAGTSSGVKVVLTSMPANDTQGRELTSTFILPSGWWYQWLGANVTRSWTTWQQIPK